MLFYFIQRSSSLICLYVREQFRLSWSEIFRWGQEFCCPERRDAAEFEFPSPNLSAQAFVLLLYSDQRLCVSKLSASEAERSLDQWNASIGRCPSGFSQSNNVLTIWCIDCLFSLTKPISRRQNKKNGKHNGMGEVPMFLSSSPRHSYQSSSGRYWKVLDELGAVFSFGSEMLGSLWRSWLTLRQRYSCS